MKVSLSHYIAVGRGGLYEQEAETTKEKTHVPFRLNVLFFCVFLMFSAVIVRLGYVQIVRGEEYKMKWRGKRTRRLVILYHVGKYLTVMGEL